MSLSPTASANPQRPAKGLGKTLQTIAIDLAAERQWLSKRIRGEFPGFTVVLTGFLNEVKEPWIALITDGGNAPDWEEDSTQVDALAPAPFQIRIAVRCRPTIHIDGYTPAASPYLKIQLTKIISQSGSRAYDAARFIVSEIRTASHRSTVIGSRVSGVVLPAQGWADTGLWHLGGEPTCAAMPRMIFGNGTQWEPNEVEFSFGDGFAFGEIPRHGLLFESFLDGRIPRRAYRRLRRNHSSFKAPTMFGALMDVIFGKDPGSIG